MLTAAQLELKREKITSSVVAACLGVDPFTSPAQAWEFIMNPKNSEPNDATEFGEIIEGPLITWAAAKKVHTTKPDLSPPFRQVYEWSGCHVDATANCLVTGERVLFEAKAPGPAGSSKFGEPWTDQIPYRYYLQCQWHLLHWPEANLCYVPTALVRRTYEPTVYVVKRDMELLDRIVPTLELFYENYIKTGVEPVVKRSGKKWKILDQ